MSLNLLGPEAEEYLALLDWKTIVNQITHFCHFDVNKQTFGRSITFKALAELEYQFDSLNYFIRKIENQNEGSLIYLVNCINPTKLTSDLLLRLEKQGVLDLGEIHEIAKVFESLLEFRYELEGLNLLARYQFDEGKIQNLKRKFLQDLRKFVSLEGDIDYEKHPELRELFSQLQILENKLRQLINEVAQSPQFRDSLQFTGHDVINDRYVLAIRSDSFQYDMGMIVARSESGLTLYVEPPGLREHCNKRMKLLAQIEEIINRICQQYCRTIFEHIDIFRHGHELAIIVDRELAKALFAVNKKLSRPKLSPFPILELNQLFHPLIDNPVKNDVTLSAEQKGLVISGPNTGGKTATLKAICLCHVFVQIGLYIPAIDSTIHPFDGIFYLANDHQNLGQGLSSFSAEVKNYNQLIDELGHSNLIIIDEIFNSTSSEEASALAIGLFEEIHKFSIARILVSTHHQMLKTLMHEKENYVSCHVGFDLETHRPTYKLINGIPGSSMAIDIFALLTEKKNIHSEAIVKKAKAVLDSKMVSYEALLQIVSQKEINLDKLLKENNETNRQLRNQKQAMEGVLKLKMQDTLSEYTKKIDKIFLEAEKIVESAKNGDIHKERHLINAISPIKNSLEEEQLTLFTPKEEDVRPIHSNDKINYENIRPGERYFCTLVNRPVTITSVNIRKKEAIVQNGGLSIRCPIESLKKLRPEHFISRPIRRPEVEVNVIFSDDELTMEYDCRGMRLDEFQRLMEKATSDLLGSKIPFLHVIHGHGDGILKKWLRDHLNQFPILVWEIPDHSHDGATRVTLKN